MLPGFTLTSEILASITGAADTVAYDHENNCSAAFRFYAPMSAYVFKVGPTGDNWAAVCLTGMRVSEFKVFRAADGAQGAAHRWLTARLELDGAIPYTRTTAFAPLSETQAAAGGRRF